MHVDEQTYRKVAKHCSSYSMKGKNAAKNKSGDTSVYAQPVSTSHRTTTVPWICLIQSRKTTISNQGSCNRQVSVF